jgi:hypothetical protein
LAREEAKRARRTRELLSARLKIMLADLGLTPEAAGKMLHVTPRTVRYWISGKVLVPYAAYKLLRILTGAELPQPGWDGWHMHSGKLWTPEGHGFIPSDSSWWGHLVGKARLFKVIYDRNRELELLLQRGGREAGVGGALPLAPALAGAGGGAATSPTGEAGRAAQPPRPKFIFKTL